MKGRILDFSMSFNRRQRITIELDTDFREGYEALKDFDLEVNIKKWRKKRSNDANKYFHVLVNEIAEAKGISDEEVKQSLVEDYGVIDRDDDGNPLGFKLLATIDPHRVSKYVRPIRTVEENGKRFICYLILKPSHEMDTKEMSRLIEGAIYTAEELNIDTDTPEKAAWWDSLKGNDYEKQTDEEIADG